MIVMLNITEITEAMMSLENFNGLVREEYKPYDLLSGIDKISNITARGVAG